MRALGIALGVIMMVTGAVWTFQGLGYLEGSPMTGQEICAILGPLNLMFAVVFLFCRFVAVEL